MIQIELRLFGSLRDQLGQGTKGKGNLSLSAQSKVSDALRAINIQQDVLVSIRDQEVRHDQELQEGDILFIFPPVAGG
ncbi:MAG: MoaD/ThiS family protein [Deinococcales bacterium]